MVPLLFVGWQDFCRHPLLHCRWIAFTLISCPSWVCACCIGNHQLTPPTIATCSLLFAGFPLLPTLRVISAYKSLYASRFPCLLQSMRLTRVGEYAWSCMYNATMEPLRSIQEALGAALCSLSGPGALSQALRVNWHRYCASARSDAAPPAANESWSGVYFVEGRIALDLHDIGITGELPTSGHYLCP